MSQNSGRIISLNKTSKITSRVDKPKLDEGDENQYFLYYIIYLDIKQSGDL